MHKEALLTIRKSAQKWAHNFINHKQVCDEKGAYSWPLAHSSKIYLIRIDCSSSYLFQQDQSDLFQRCKLKEKQRRLLHYCDCFYKQPINDICNCGSSISAMENNSLVVQKMIGQTSVVVCIILIGEKVKPGNHIKLWSTKHAASNIKSYFEQTKILLFPHTKYQTFKVYSITVGINFTVIST